MRDDRSTRYANASSHRISPSPVHSVPRTNLTWGGTRLQNSCGVYFLRLIHSMRSSELQPVNLTVARSKPPMGVKSAIWKACLPHINSQTDSWRIRSFSGTLYHPRTPPCTPSSTRIPPHPCAGVAESLKLRPACVIDQSWALALDQQPSPRSRRGWASGGWRI